MSIMEQTTRLMSVNLKAATVFLLQLLLLSRNFTTLMAKEDDDGDKNNSSEDNTMIPPHTNGYLPYHLPLTDSSIREAVSLWTSDDPKGRDVALEFYGPIESWKTGSVTDMSRLFRNKLTFNDDITQWDVSSVTSMQLMFYGASSFDYDLSSWNISSAINLGGMFVHASSYKSTLCWPSLSKYAFVEDMFCGANAGATLDPCCVDEVYVKSACCGQACSAFCFETTTDQPTESPTITPTGKPVGTPTANPTTEAPTEVPTDVPTTMPTTIEPTSGSPTGKPTASPTEAPTVVPTFMSTTIESTTAPTGAPTTGAPSVRVLPTVNPTTHEPSSFPSLSPTITPSASPSLLPITIVATEAPNNATVLYTEPHITIVNYVTMNNTDLIRPSPSDDVLNSDDESPSSSTTDTNYDEGDEHINNEISVSRLYEDSDNGAGNGAGDNDSFSGWIGGIVGFFVGAGLITSLVVSRRRRQRLVGAKGNDLVDSDDNDDEQLRLEIQMGDDDDDTVVSLIEGPPEDEELVECPVPKLEEMDITIEHLHIQPASPTTIMQVPSVNLGDGDHQEEAVELSWSQSDLHKKNNTTSPYQTNHRVGDGYQYSMFSSFDSEAALQSQPEEEDGGKGAAAEDASHVLPRVQLREVRVFEADLD